MKKNSNIVILSLLLLYSSFVSAEELEKSVCGFKEPFIFWLWKKAAGKANENRISDIENIESVTYVTKDDRKLKGYKLKSASATGYLLVLLGNAMLADQLIARFIDYQRKGIDVYIFDYRGYGRSEGKSRLKAIVDDYTGILDMLDTSGYEKKLIYAMSFGGIIITNSLAHSNTDHRVVIDSTPSSLSNYGCHEDYDPIKNIPSDTSDYLVVAGGKDLVVKPAASQELNSLLINNGAEHFLNENMGHPFMDRDSSVHNMRMEKVQEFLTRRIEE